MSDYTINGKRCDECDVSEYSTSVRAPSTYRQYEFDREFENLCRDCAEANNVLTAASMADDDLIAAVITDSIGYAGPHHAALHVRDYRAGKETVCCERGGAMFGGDLSALIESAVRRWAYKSDDERAALLAKVARWQEIEGEDRVASMGISMGVPVGGL